MGVRVIAGQAKGRSLRLPRGASTRPTTERVRSALFSILAPRLREARVLDLFAGTGALGIEALSRGASKADFVESHPTQYAALKSNLQTLGFTDRAHVSAARVEQAIDLLAGPYEFIFLDPPYSYPHLNELLERISTSALMSSDGSTMVVEHSRREELPEAFGAIGRMQHRIYGDTAISIYQQEGAPW